MSLAPPRDLRILCPLVSRQTDLAPDPASRAAVRSHSDPFRHEKRKVGQPARNFLMDAESARMPISGNKRRLDEQTDSLPDDSSRSGNGEPRAGPRGGAARAPLQDPVLWKSFNFDYILKPFLNKDHALLTQDPSRPTMCKRHQQQLLDQQHPHHDVTRPVFFPQYNTDSPAASAGHRTSAVFAYGDCTDGQSKVVQVVLAHDSIESATMLMQMRDRIADLETIDDNNVVIAHGSSVSLWSVSGLGKSGGSLADLAAAAISALEPGGASPSVTSTTPRAGGTFATASVHFPCRVNMVQALPASVLAERKAVQSDYLLAAGNHLLACLDVSTAQIATQHQLQHNSATGVITSLEWFPSQGQVFSCTTDAGQLRLFDLRRPNLLATHNPQVQLGLYAHGFTGDFTVVAAGLGGAIHVHDIRKLTERVHLVNDPFLDDVGEFGIDLHTKSLVAFGNPGLTSWTIESSCRLKLNGFHTSRPHDCQGLYFMRGKIVLTRREHKGDGFAERCPPSNSEPTEAATAPTAEANDAPYRNTLLTIDTCGAFSTWELPNVPPDQEPRPALAESELQSSSVLSSMSKAAADPTQPSHPPPPGPVAATAQPSS